MVFQDPEAPKPDQFVELKSPYVTYKIACTTPSAPHGHRSSTGSSRFAARSRSRPHTSFNEDDIQEIDETKNTVVEHLMPHSESPTDLNKIKLDISVHVEVIIIVDINFLKKK